MDIPLSAIKAIRQTRGGIALKLSEVDEYYFTEEQFICFHQALRYVVENYDDHIQHHGIGYDVIRPDFMIWGDDRFFVTPNWENNPEESLENQLQHIDQLLGFYYRESEFVYVPPFMGGGHNDDLMVAVRRSGSLSLDIGFTFRRDGSARTIVPGYIRTVVEAEANKVYNTIEPFVKLPAYFSYVSDLLGGVTDTSSLPDVGYKLALECGLGQLTLGNPTKDDLRAIQNKLMK
ncbi:hypothetical protein pEaSNUABM8_00093 [Erwinia phage pEa_SNUABM_8]|nr:hypothetical protein pEaSNUABM8_00093 [Erwinia phage pEa_SNUABM_8]QVW54845.1 hypothetical protein pEaSNUABM4_00092 [Erwinia phage pEa_SNUABM_4]